MIQSSLPFGLAISIRHRLPGSRRYCTRPRKCAHDHRRRVSKKITLGQSGAKVAARAVVFRFLPPPSIGNRQSVRVPLDKGEPRVTVGRKSHGSQATGLRRSPGLPEARKMNIPTLSFRDGDGMPNSVPVSPTASCGCSWRAGMIQPRLLAHPPPAAWRSKWRRPTCVRSGYLAWRDGRARAEPDGGCVLLQATRDDGCSPALAGDDRRFWRRLLVKSSESPSQSRHDTTPIGFGARRKKVYGFIREFYQANGSFIPMTPRAWSGGYAPPRPS